MSAFVPGLSGAAKKAVQITVAVALLALLWHATDGPDALHRLASSDLRWLALALLALTLQTLLSALRWRVTARQLGITLGTRRAIAEYYLSQVVNQSLPGGVIGDAGRAVRSRGEAGLMAAGLAVMFERLAGQIALMATFAVAFVVTVLMPGGLDWPGWVAVPVATVLGVSLLLPGLVIAGALLPGAPGQALRRARATLHRALLARDVLVTQSVLSFGTTVCNLAAFAFCARAVGVNLGLAAVAGLVPLVLFAMLIPISVSGWGLREGAAAAVLPLAGVTASGALAASVAFGLAVLVSVLPGLVFLWRAPAATAQGTTTTPQTSIRRA